MSKADEIYRATCREILDHGVWDTDLQVRPIGMTARLPIQSKNLVWSTGMTCRRSSQS